MKRFFKVAGSLIILLGLVACASSGGGAGQFAGQSVASRTSVIDDEFNSAVVLMKNGRTDEAFAAFNAMNVKHPQLSGPVTNMGIIAAGKGNFAEASQYFQKALKNNSRNVVALNWAGYLQSREGNCDAALGYYSRALAVRHDYAEARLNTAILYDTCKHNLAEAVRHYRLYLDMTGNNNLAVIAWVGEIENRIDRVAAAGAGGGQ